MEQGFYLVVTLGNLFNVCGSDYFFALSDFASFCLFNFLSACFPTDIRAKSSFSQDDATALAKYEDWRAILKKIPKFL